MVEHLLEQTQTEIADLGLVVANNHLFRIDAFERTLPWAQALNQYQPSYLEEHNLLSAVPKLELSHHLAHAWSVLHDAPFREGLLVVMDGMGTTKSEFDRSGEGYHSEGALPKSSTYWETPTDHSSTIPFGWREGETAFQFKGLELEREWKRWIPENSPSLLYNYGFENMESLGAVYSRVSSHLFGDWNSCGKVMGMAPWAESWSEAPADWIIRGPLEELEVNWERLQEAPHPHQWGDESVRPGYARLAADVQSDLESVTLQFLSNLKEKTGHKNLILTGGVALNCAMNGRLAREAGFENIWIPPWPGDEGIAIGCAAFGHHSLHPASPAQPQPSPYLGTSYTESQILEAVNDYEPWLECFFTDDITETAADSLADGKVIAWFQGAAEFGPRALGNRSILADPRIEGMVERINSAIKKREAYRPFAPVVLAEHADTWFEQPPTSPFMSFTAQVSATNLDAVTHVDGSARLQTLEQGVNPKFEALLRAFQKRTNVPVLLNTSFNVGGEPLVQEPGDALRSFLDSDLDLLFLGNHLIRKAPWPDNFDAIPLASPGTSETLSDQEGETLNVRLMSRGESFDADLLDQGLWEACTGEHSLEILLQWFEEEHQEDSEDCVSRLQTLWNRRLIRFLPPA